MTTALETKLVPLNDRILVEPLPLDEKTAGGVYLPQSTQDKSQMGRIVAVGEGKLNDDGTHRPMKLKNGQKVIYSAFAGTTTRANGKEYMIMRETDVLLRIDD